MGESNALMECVEFLAHTCGLCDGVFDKSMINQHECLQGYKQLWINSKNNYFYPLLDDNETIVTKDADGNEKQVLYRQVENETEPGKKRKYVSIPLKIKRECLGIRSPRQFTHDDEELLIKAVREREALWNNKLPVEERTIKIRSRLWDDIAEALEYKISPEGAKAKFKNLWDSYRRIVQTETLIKNGVVKKDNRKKWHHYDSMEFLRDSCILARRTASNIENDSFVDENDCEMNDTSTPKNNKKSQNSIESGKGKSKNNQAAIGKIINKKTGRLNRILPDLGTNDSLMDDSDFDLNSSNFQIEQRKKLAWERIADAFCSSQTSDEVLPAVPQRDEIDSILYVIGCRARKVPYNKAMNFLNRFFLESCTLGDDSEGEKEDELV